MCARGKVVVTPSGLPADTPAGVTRAPTLILGIGNVLLRDEGVGVRVVEVLRERPLLDDVEVADGGTAGVDLLEEICHRRTVIVVDAVHARARPGTIVRCLGEDLVANREAVISLHEFGFLEALRLAEYLGCAPEHVVVFGVTPRELGYGLELSREVAAAVPRVVELLLREVALQRQAVQEAVSEPAPPAPRPRERAEARRPKQGI